MKLLFDIGNRRCKYAEYDGTDIHYHAPSIAHADCVDACLPTSLDCVIKEILVSSVRSDAFNQALSHSLQARFQLRPRWITSTRSLCGVTTLYRVVEQLGVDRLLALVGAWRRVGGACVVADCGTAVTVDALNNQGVHQGGVIMPGLHLLHTALSVSTDGLPVLSEYGVGDNSEEQVLFATDTHNAIAEGCRSMFVHAVAGAMREMQTRLISDGAAQVTLLATGGDGGLLSSGEGSAVDQVTNLVLEGLAMVSDQPAHQSS